MLATWHFHIEISSKCTLRCPRCARQEVPDTLINTELDLAFFQRNFTPEFVRDHVHKITFCGDDGDPIYAHDLIPVVAYLKNIKPVEIVIVTNGSHRKPGWWQQLASVLDDHDQVHFSIDGWDQESNQQYRVNCDFDTIIDGIRTLQQNSACRLIWAAIAFKFNETQINRMQTMALDLGMDTFQLTKSTKFGQIYPAYGQQDVLQPSAAFLSSSYRFERVVIPLRRQPNQISKINRDLFDRSVARNGVRPLCEIGNKGLYIDARGRLFPCCWVANRYTHNSEWQNIAAKFDLNQRTLADAVDDKFWSTRFQTFEWQECQTKCAVAKVDEKYATEW